MAWLVKRALELYTISAGALVGRHDEVRSTHFPLAGGKSPLSSPGNQLLQPTNARNARGG